MTAQHTPGPWQWYWRHEDGVTNCGVFHEPRSGMAYSVCRAPQYQTEQKWMADARLIAAAPELLEALIALHTQTNSTELAKAHDKARSAIAKATGGRTP